MKKLAIILILLPVFAYSQIDKRSLIIAEVDNNKGKGQLQHLVSYNFINGELKSKDTILTASITEMRWDIGYNMIFNNRYALSLGGPLIDLQENIVLTKRGHDFISYKNDTLFFKKNIGEGLLYFDFEKREYEEVPKSNFLSHLDCYSPNLQMGIQVDYSILPRRIFLYTQKEKKLLIPDAGNGATFISSNLSKVPVSWYNNDTLFYARFYRNRIFDWRKYNFKVIIKNDSVYNKETNDFIKMHMPTCMEIYKVVISDGTQKLMLFEEKIPKLHGKARFYHDKAGHFIFITPLGAYKYNESIDKFQKHNQIVKNLGHGFTYKSLKGQNDVYYFDKNLGSFWCPCYDAKTIDGFIAFKYGKKGSKYTYATGVKVWNTITKKWTAIKIPMFSEIVGWIKR